MPALLERDPATGFLEAMKADAFSVEKKQLVLDYLATHPYRVLAACDLVGIQDSTFYRHVAQDASFAQAVQALKVRRIEEIEEKLADMALVKEQVADRIFFLKCHKPGVYNPSVRHETAITITVDLGSLELENRRLQTLEAEIVPPKQLTVNASQENVV